MHKVSVHITTNFCWTTIINYISSVPNKKTGYVAEVIFENGLVTSYKKELPLIQQMDGTAEIITKDKRLIMRFIDPIVALFDSGL